ncbi:MAG: type II toxin-antitoxin system VapC family toxin [Acidimicrobiales bacterium]
MSESSLLTVIAEGDRVLLDTTVLAAFLDSTDATHPVARFVMRELVETGRNPAVVSMVTVMEILVRPMRAVPPGHHTVLAFLRTHPNLTCAPVDLQVAQDAAHLRADRKFAPPDALVVGTGLATQARHLVTNDHDWSSRLVSMAARISVGRMSEHLPFP